MQNDRNFPAYPPYHSLFEDLVYVNKHVQPSHEYCMNDLFTAYYGEITPQVSVCGMRYLDLQVCSNSYSALRLSADHFPERDGAGGDG